MIQSIPVSPRSEVKWGSFHLIQLITVVGLIICIAWAFAIIVPILLAASLVAIGTPAIRALHRSFSSTKQPTLHPYSRIKFAAGLLLICPLITAPLVLALEKLRAEPSKVIITFDQGGDLVQYDQRVWEASQKHMPAATLGLCESACTMWLGDSAGACVSPSATLGFHAPEILRTSAVASGEDVRYQQNYWRRMLLQFYPPSLRAYVVAHHWLDSAEMKRLRGVELIRMGVKRC